MVLDADNGETGVDCGGVNCAPCVAGLSCDIPSDCESSNCGFAGTCEQATCEDGIPNGSESDADCGGSCTQACPDNSGCSVADDCDSGVCLDEVCQEARCGDGVSNQASESCDDGNLQNGDGCDNNCTDSGCGNGL